MSLRSALKKIKLKKIVKTIKKAASDSRAVAQVVAPFVPMVGGALGKAIGTTGKLGKTVASVSKVVQKVDTGAHAIGKVVKKAEAVNAQIQAKIRARAAQAGISEEEAKRQLADEGTLGDVPAALPEQSNLIFLVGAVVVGFFLLKD